MDQRERQVIDDLFGKLREVERQSPRRDPEAEAYIARQVASLPAAPYYMAQAILAQEQALASSHPAVRATATSRLRLVAVADSSQASSAAVGR